MYYFHKNNPLFRVGKNVLFGTEKRQTKIAKQIAKNKKALENKALVHVTVYLVRP